VKGKLAVTVLLVGLTAILGWAQATAPNPEISAKAEDKATLPSDPNVSVTMSSVSPEPSFVIASNDVLHIAVWQEPDLTVTLPVRSDGMISVPLLNDVRAAGLTPMQLAALLTQKLKKYVANPHVTVVVTEIQPLRVYVLGEVLHTGPISLLPHMTVLQALATAGLSQFASTKRIYVLRTDNGQEQKIPFNYPKVIKGEAMTQNIFLRPGDTIVVP